MSGATETNRRWQTVAATGAASWYLDPLVAAQKRRLNAGLVLDAVKRRVARALKTDLFEEAYGDDSPLPELREVAGQWFGMDGTVEIVARARARTEGVRFLAADVRQLPLATASLDLVFSNSTLDHFETRREFETALAELARVVRPEGLLILTLDNPLNPLYWPLRWLSATRLSPFPLGYTTTPNRLRRLVEQSGFKVRSTGVLIHSPRLVSTALFLALRRMIGSRADAVIGGLLAAFQLLDALPTRPFTACFLTLHAVRRG